MQIQKNRQMMEQLEKECNDGNQDQEQQGTGKATATTETAAAQPRISARWTADENQVALLALRDWGKNFAVSCCVRCSMCILSNL